jgi:hypothetical protein
MQALHLQNSHGSRCLSAPSCAIGNFADLYDARAALNDALLSHQLH